MAENKNRRLIWVMIIYLLGIFIGAIDTGILTPARTVVQNDLGVGEKTGIWMITAFTLAYACSMPILGKLADRIGRKRIYMIAITLFGAGSLICGLSNFAGSFPMLIVGRVVQAIGGGGIVPLATAEFGTGFPEEKRGMALGLVGGVYGIANILGATLGSAILDLVGTQNWHWLFFINLPICVFVVLAGIFALPAGEKKPAQRIDILGTFVLVVMIMSLLYGLNNLDFFDFGASITQTNVYPFLIAFAVLVPLFWLVEKRAADPVLNIGYFKSRRVVIIFVLAIIVGICLMGMVFVPQFAENALKSRAGSGGYYVTILGLFAGIGAPLSGRLVDKFGPKKILFLGFGISIAGALFLALYATLHASLASVIISLVLVGSGLGFVMGTPLNYMMLANAPKEESNSALSALSLMRSIGTTIGPILMIGFIAQAGAAAQSDITALLPPVSSIQITADETLTDGIKDDLNAIKSDITLSNDLQTSLLTQIDALEALNKKVMTADDQTQVAFNDIKNDPDFADMLDEMDFTMPEGMDTPDFSDIRARLTQNSGMSADDIDQYLDMLDFNNQSDMSFDMSGDATLPDDVLQRLQSSDVNSITGDIVYLVQRMFEINTPSVISDIQSGIGDGVAGIGDGISGLSDAAGGVNEGIGGLTDAVSGVSSGIDGTQKGLDGMNEGMSGMDDAISGIRKGIRGINSGISEMKKAVAGIESGITGMQSGLTGLDAQIAAKQAELDASIGAGDPPAVWGPIQGQLTGLKAARDSLSAQLADAQSQKSQLESQISKMKRSISSMKASIRSIQDAQEKLSALINDVQTEKDLLTTMKSGLQTASGSLQDMLDALTRMSDRMTDAQTRLNALKDAIPGYFAQAESDYIAVVQSKQTEIEDTFQRTVNHGFTGMYYAVVILCAAACIALVFYRHPKRTALPEQVE
jgi:EmrB/QacA subfamily drug resistance transporter